MSLLAEHFKLVIVMTLAGFVYYFYHSHEHLKDELAIAHSANQALVQQLVDERQAVIEMQQRTARIAAAATARQQRFETAIKQRPKIRQAAAQSISPAMKFALGELRQKEQEAP